jgi:DNA-binding MarR family transcriptional regulator
MKTTTSKPRARPDVLVVLASTRVRDGRKARNPNLLIAIHELSDLIGRAFYGEIATRFDIGVAEWRVLLDLAGRPASSSAEIAAAWGMEKMTVSRAVRRLEAMGLVARRIDRKDRRRQTISLTLAGRRFYARVLPIANGRYRDIVSCLDRADIESLGKLLRRLIDRTRRLAAGSGGN